MKVGRNDLCPCGSGKKYKKCCLGGMGAEGPATAAPGVRSSREISRLMEKQHGLRMHPWVVTRHAEDSQSSPEIAELVQSLQRKGLVWTSHKVAAMSTGEIEAQLMRLGVRHDTERFLRDAGGRWSAWDVSDVWREQDGVTCEGTDDDFLGLAACELWKRLLPERPSMEMLDEQMQEGYDLVNRGDGVEGCEVWWRFWRTLLACLPADVTSAHQADEVFHGRQSVFNWMQDFEETLLSVARNNDAWARRGVQYCRERMARFTDDETSLQVNVRRALSELLVVAGQGAEGLAVLEETVRKWPRDLWAHVGLADFHAGWFRPQDGYPVDGERAVRILQEAQSKVLTRPEERDVIPERIAEYRRERDT